MEELIQNGVGNSGGLSDGRAITRPASTSHPVGDGDLAPNETLYVRNLNEKVNKRVLKQQLYAAFIPFGRILDIVALRTTALRGQAFVVFEKLASATSAMQKMQGFDFLGKPMVIQYARTKSDKIAKRLGIHVSRDSKRKHPPSTQQPMTDSGDYASGIDTTAAMAVEPNPGALHGLPFDGHIKPTESTLVIDNLPPNTPADGSTVADLVRQYPGFLGVHSVPDNPSRCLVSFSTVDQAEIARNGLQNFRISQDHALQISFVNSETVTVMATD